MDNCLNNHLNLNRRLRYLLSVWLLMSASFFSTYTQAQTPDKNQLTLAESVTEGETDATIVLATNISSSFTANSITAREARDLFPRLDCVFKKMGRAYRVQVTPWRRAYLDVKSKRVDGFFTAIAMRQADTYATLSAPLVLENWYWFWRTDTDAPDNWRNGYKLGSILGSQQEAWLADAGYRVEMSANNLPQLIKMLQSKRIDVVLADREHFLQASASLNFNASEFQSRFFRYVPLGVYFNQGFLQKHAGFLEHFNNHLNACGNGGFQLLAHERHRLSDLLAEKITRWKNMPELQRLLQQRKHAAFNLTSEEIAKEDEIWMQAFASGNHTYRNRFIDSAMSSRLSAEKNHSKELITEIFVTDVRGLNVAVSDMTSDYWQGDEDKFTQAFAKPNNSLFFDVIRYDESTHHFQVHISVPLYDVKGVELLGVMVIGVDIETALSLAE